MSRKLSILVGACVTVVVVLVLTVGSASSQTGVPRVSVFPSPGTDFARPGTAIALRGVTPDKVGRVTVAGTSTGRHTFRVVAHTDRKGVSLVVDKPFARGEKVGVATDLNIRGGRAGDFRIGIARTGNPIRQSPVREAPDRRSRIQFFHSRKDLRPSRVSVRRGRGKLTGGYLFAAPKIGPGDNGPVILDNSGEVVFFHKLAPRLEADAFRPVRIGGKPVLSWWEGFTNFGTGNGTIKLLDETYRSAGEIKAGNGFDGLDPHEFQITGRGTALVMILSTVYRDLRSIGGARSAQVLDSVVQEIDIPTGLVLYEWHSLDHVSIRESYTKPPKGNGHIYDYFHINSAEELRDGHFMISARNTWGVYKIDRYTGKVWWRLGGKRSSFRQPRDTRFAWQHDARQQRSGVVTIFDNGAAPPVHKASRGIGLKLRGRNVRLVKEYRHSRKLLSGSQGNMQRLGNGNVLLGWGQNPDVTEHRAHGQQVFWARFTFGNMSYRWHRAPWVGRPAAPPDVVASSDGKRTKIYASWNGATGVARWDLLAGDRVGAVAPAGTVRRSGFETLGTIPGARPFVQAIAKDAAGRTLGTSRVVTVRR